MCTCVLHVQLYYTCVYIHVCMSELTANLCVKEMRGQRYICNFPNIRSGWYVALFTSLKVWRCAKFSLSKHRHVANPQLVEGRAWQALEPNIRCGLVYIYIMAIYNTIIHLAVHLKNKPHLILGILQRHSNVYTRKNIFMYKNACIKTTVRLFLFIKSSH